MYMGAASIPFNISMDMREKRREARVLHTLFGGSFRTAQRTDMRKRRRARAFFLHFKTSHFFCGGILDRHNAQKKKGGNTRFFLPFLPEHTQKKLHMIGREFEFVVVRMY